MKKALKSLMAVAVLATVAFAANIENPLYAPASQGFYSKTGFSSMYKKSDDNLAMQAKDWVHEQEFPIWRIYEDFGFGLTDRFAIRGAFGYTHDGAIGRSGPHNARLGLNYRAINQPIEAVVWDLYMDAWLGGISKMKANLIASNVPIVNKGRDTLPLSFKYDNYANGRWGIWLGTQVGKTFGQLTLSAYGEFQKTFGNNNNEIKITDSAKTVINGMVKANVKPGIKDKIEPGIKASVMPIAIQGACEKAFESGAVPTVEFCLNYIDTEPFKPVKDGAEAAASHIADSVALHIADSASLVIAKSYVNGLPDDFNVDTKGIWDYVAGLKASYDINSNWSVGGGFTWRHRGTNSVEKVNIASNSTNPDTATVAAITEGIVGKLGGSMEDGVEEYTITLLGSRKITENLQLTLFGEYTFDTAEDKAQLGSDIRAEVGLRVSCQF